VDGTASVLEAPPPAVRRRRPSRPLAAALVGLEGRATHLGGERDRTFPDRRRRRAVR
jgi:hypothetical protein